MAKEVVIKKRGKKPIRFREGGLHRSLGVPLGEKIPEEKMRAALRGEYGELAQKQARMAVGLLAKGRKTAAANRRKRSSKRKRNSKK